MEILDLEIFKRLYLSRNITAISRELYLSQPTISYRLNKLQEELGAKLYEYDGEYHFTNQGKTFYRYCEKVLDEHQQMQNNLNLQQSPKINLSTVATHLYLDNIYTLLSENNAYPVIHHTNSDTAIREIVEDKALMSIVGGIKIDLPKAISSINLKKEKLVLVFNTKCRDDIADIPIILDQANSGISQIVNDYLKQYENVNIVGEIGMTSERISLVNKHRLGFFITESYLYPTIKQYPNVKISDNYFIYRDIVLLFHSRHKSNPLIKKIIEKLNTD